MIENIQYLLIIFTNFLSSKPFEVIGAAFFGGLFAGLFSNYFESKRRIFDKRSDKYHEHKNTIVQIEHELVPARLNHSRNIQSLEDAIKHTNPNNIRLIMRFYPLIFSTGLSLKLQNIDLINDYAEMYSTFESFNSDIKYIEGMIQMITIDQKNNKADESLLNSYVTMLEHLHKKSLEIEQESLRLLAKCQFILNTDDNKLKKIYLKNGDNIKYEITKEDLLLRSKMIEKEENRIPEDGEQQPKFFVPFMDLKKIITKVAFV